MNTEEYWEDVALKREIAVQENATATAVDILRLYDEALDDIESEVQKIKANFQRRFGIDEETADYFLTKAQEEENLKMLTQALEAAPDEQARKDILTYINRDGLSVRAYSARIERYQAVKESIYARIKMIAVKGIPMLENMMTKAYKESYYGNIEDTARGLDVGIDFALLDDEAIRQAVNVPWKGSRFSKRLWDNTERLAKVAQDLTVKAMMSGESLTKTANKLADAMQSSKFHATTLIRTEVSHAHNMADLKAYEDMDARKYKYLATLDYRTCTTCQPLDNTSHNLADAKEGVNCPVMHPRCRCTTTIDMEYAKRRARDPVTGKSELVNGDITYNEWVNNMSPEQKQALQIARKKDDNKTADKLQHAKYKKVLGTKEVPKGFKEFQEMKHTNPQRYNELKSLYRQANSVDKSAKSGIMKVGREQNMLKVATGGKRNEKPLTEEQVNYIKDYAVTLGMPRERIYYVDYDCTAYGSLADVLRIGTDVYPSEEKQLNPNCNVSVKGAVAHEIVGHRDAALVGKTQNDEILEEVQASLRASILTPNLANSERMMLARDGLYRLHNTGKKLKDVKSLLYLE